jgi:hypothetical protein
MNKHPDSVFGKDAVSFADVVDYVRSLETSALTFADYADVIAILSYMRDEQVKIHDRLTEMGKRVDEREADLERREKELSLRMAAVEMVLKGREHTPAPATKPSRSYFWR